MHPALTSAVAAAQRSDRLAYAAAARRARQARRARRAAGAAAGHGVSIRLPQAVPAQPRAV